jgi:hypothetical protein
MHCDLPAPSLHRAINAKTTTDTQSPVSLVEW